MPSGGPRAGAGRPRKAEKFARPIAAAEKRIADKLPHLVDKLLELVDGVTIESEDQHGETHIYQRPPDRQAAQYLLDRIIGKPKERLDLSAEHTGEVRIRVEYADTHPAADETA